MLLGKCLFSFFDEVGMSNYLAQEPPTNGTNAKCIVNDQRLLRLVCNTLMIEVRIILFTVKLLKNYENSLGLITMERTTCIKFIISLYPYFS